MSIGQVLNPLFQAVADVLTFFFSLVPNYAIAIALLTIVVMVILAPLTLKSTRSMLSMQRLAPEVKKLQQKYKGDRQKLNEEMMKLYKENNVSPVGGCLPMLLQLPFFFILYNVVRGLTNTVVVHGHTVPSPKYINHSSLLYHDLIASGGKMESFGINLSVSATAHHTSFAAALPYYVIILVAIALQYLQMRQLTARNPQAAQANPQAQRLQKYMPLIFAFIYINIPAAVNIYFIVSSLFRVGQQELMFRFDPVIKNMSGAGAVVAKATEIRATDRSGPAKGPKEIGNGKAGKVAPEGRDSGKAADAARRDAAPPDEEPAVTDGRASNGREASRRPGGDARARGSRARRGQSRAGRNGSGDSRGDRPKPHPRSQAKRPRRAR